MATNMTAALKIGAAMQYTRLIGKYPRETLQRLMCRKCERPAAQYDDGLRCICCGGIDLRLATPDEWQRVHAVESERHKRGRVPDAVFFDRGDIETEARAARAKSRDAAAQLWFDFAHDDQWVHTDRFKILRLRCAHLIASTIEPEIIDAAEQAFIRAGKTIPEASKAAFGVIRAAIEMLRVNKAEPPRIVRKKIAKDFDLDPSAVKLRVRVHVSNEDGETTSARQGYRYAPPMARLLGEIEQVVNGLERRF